MLLGYRAPVAKALGHAGPRQGLMIVVIVWGLNSLLHGKGGKSVEQHT